MAELLCPQHGPYDASYGTCPICSGGANLPPAPEPLMDDDMPTDLGAGPAASPAGAWDDEGPTELGAARKSGRILDIDDEDPTELGVYARDDVTELDVVETGFLGLLWIQDGRRRGRTFKIKDGTVIGRSKGDVILDDPKASNPHAKFTLEDDQFVVWDFGSRNGTFVNGERIRAATTLKENDRVKIGDTVFVLKVLE